MAVDFEDVARTITEHAQDMTDALNDVLKESLYEVVDAAFADCIDVDDAADAADYPQGDVGAEDEAAVDALRAAFAAGFAAAYDALQEAFEGFKNI